MIFPGASQTFRLVAPAILVLLLFSSGRSAAADKLPNPVEASFESLSLNIGLERLSGRVLRGDVAAGTRGDSGTGNLELDAVAGFNMPSLYDREVSEPPPAESATQGGPEGGFARRGGKGRLSELVPAGLIFEDVFDQRSCRQPQFSADGWAALAICRGLDAKAPSDEHVVIRRGRRVEWYPGVVAALEGGHNAHLSSDGGSFAALIKEGGRWSLHHVDLVDRTVRRLSGGFSEPRQIYLSGDGRRIAFAATMEGKPVGLLADLAAERFWVVARGRKQLRMAGLSRGGTRVLLGADPIRNVAVAIYDVERGLLFDISEKKGDMEGAAFDPDGGAVAFGAQVGGIRAVFWADTGSRKRFDLVSSGSAIYRGFDVDPKKEFLLYEVEDVGNVAVYLWSRLRRENRFFLPPGCVEASFNDGGGLLAARCAKGPAGAGVYRFELPTDY